MGEQLYLELWKSAPGRSILHYLVALVTYVKYPNLDLKINIWKKRQRKKKEI